MALCDCSQVKHEEGALFCHLCGIKLKQTCNKCGHETTSLKSQFCCMCGTSFAQPESKNQSAILTDEDCLLQYVRYVNSRGGTNQKLLRTLLFPSIDESNKVSVEILWNKRGVPNMSTLVKKAEELLLDMTSSPDMTEVKKFFF